MKMFPATNYLIVDPLTAGTEWTAAGLFLPDAAREKVYRGVVLATGPRVWDVGPGDVVHYDPYSVVELGVDGVTVVLVREPDAIAREKA